MIQSGSSAGLQNKHEPVKQYVTRKNYVAYRGKSVKMWCVFGGTPLPEIRWGHNTVKCVDTSYQLCLMSLCPFL